MQYISNSEILKEDIIINPLPKTDLLDPENLYKFMSL